MSGFLERFGDMMSEVGWIIGIGLFLIFIGLFGYALLCVADDDREEDKT